MWLNKVQIFEKSLSLALKSTKQTPKLEKLTTIRFLFVAFETFDRTELAGGLSVLQQWCCNVRDSGEDKGSRRAAHVRTPYHLLAGP